MLKMLTWHVGVNIAFQQGPGKFGKHLKRHLEPELWALLEKTYADADYAHTWDALLAMRELFRQTALPIANHFGFAYPQRDDAQVSAHLNHVRTVFSIPFQ